MRTLGRTNYIRHKETFLQNPSPKPPSSTQRNNKLPIATVTYPEKNNTVSDRSRHHYVHTDRRRKQYLHRRQNKMGATRKRPAKKNNSPSPPLKTAPATAMTIEEEEITECPSALPEDLDEIKEFIQHNKDHDYIPLMSAIAQKKNKGMLFLPFDFNTLSKLTP